MIKQIYSFNSPAKINLGLKILNKRVDGYHNINTIFCELKFGDEISFIKSRKFKLSSNGINVPLNDSNLITKAYKKLKSIAKNDITEYKIHLNKRIPIGSGLGGGSSNASTTIKALNDFWSLNLSTNDMINVALELGADAAFFIEGGVKHATGIGEKLNSIDSSFIKDKIILLIIPDFSISTIWAYKKIKKILTVYDEISKINALVMPINWQLFENDFEKVVKSAYPKIGEIISVLNKTDVLHAGLSGSGSTVYGIYGPHDDLKYIRDQFPDSYHTIQTYVNCNC